MIIDITITLIIIFGLIIGFFRNPLMSIIHLVLFVAFTFAFYPLYAYVIPLILEIHSQSLADLASNCANAIAIANNEIYGFGQSIGINLDLFNSLYASPAFLEAAFKSAISSFLFLISAVISLVVSYGLAWIIYYLIKNHSDLYKKITIKLPLRVTISFVSTTLFLFFALSCIGSPCHIMVYNYRKVVDKVNTIHLMEEVETEYHDVQNLIYKIREMSNELAIYEDKLIKLKETSESEYFFNFASLITIGEFENDINLLLKEIDKSNLPYNEKRDLKNELNTLTSLFDEKKKLIEESSTIFFTYETEFDLSLEKISSEKENFQNGINAFDSTVQTLTSLDSDIAKYRDILNGIENKIPRTYWYNFLFSINYGFLDFKYEGEIYNFNIELNKFIDEIDTTLDTDLELIKSFIVEEVVKNKERLEEVNNKLDDYEEDFYDKQNEFDNYLKENDVYKEDLKEFIESTNTRLEEIKKELGLA